jgi:xylulokinase
MAGTYCSASTSHHGREIALLRPNGKVVATHVEEYPLSLPKPGWAEQDAEGWWTATARACRVLLEKSRVKPLAVAGISFSGQMHGLVCLDRAGQPLRPAILWCDQRTTAECRAITRAIGFKRLLRVVGNAALEGFTLPKSSGSKNTSPAFTDEPIDAAPEGFREIPHDRACRCRRQRRSGNHRVDIERKQWAQGILKALVSSRGLLPRWNRST